MKNKPLTFSIIICFAHDIHPVRHAAGQRPAQSAVGRRHSFVIRLALTRA